jgi:hypothetical protein
MTDTGPFDPQIRHALLKQGYCWFIPRPEQDPTMPIPIGVGYSLPAPGKKGVEPFEALEREQEEEAKPAAAAGRKGRKKTKKEIDAELAALHRLRERPVREPVADLEPVLTAKTLSYPVPFKLVNFDDPAEVGEASFLVRTRIVRSGRRLPVSSGRGSLRVCRIRATT